MSNVIAVDFYDEDWWIDEAFAAMREATRLRIVEDEDE